MASQQVHNLPHDSRGPEVLAIVWAFTGAALLFVIGRILIRTKLVKHPGWDDFVVVLSMLIALVYSATCTVAVENGTGSHIWDIKPQDIPYAIKTNVIALTPGVFSFAVPKFAVVLLIIRVIEPPKWHRVVLFSLCSLVMALVLVNAILVLVQCGPPSGLWNPTPSTTCLPGHITVDFAIADGSLSAFTDFCLAIYPVTQIWALQMNKSRKIAISILMSMGAIAGCIAIVKCTKLPSLGNHTDPLYATADLLYWTSIESNLLIIAASIPTFGPLVRAITEAAKTSSGKSGSHEPKHTTGYLQKLSSLSDPRDYAGGASSPDDDLDDLDDKMLRNSTSSKSLEYPGRIYDEEAAVGADRRQMSLVDALRANPAPAAAGAAGIEIHKHVDVLVSREHHDGSGRSSTEAGESGAVVAGAGAGASQGRAGSRAGSFSRARPAEDLVLVPEGYESNLHSQAG